MAGQQAVQDGAEPVYVGRGRQLHRPAGLFRRHVARRAYDRGGVGRVVAGSGKQLGYAEIGHVWFAGRVEQDVGWLQVAMEHATLVRVVDGAGNLRDQAGDTCLRGRARPPRARIRALRVRRDRVIGHALLEAPALDQSHAEVVLPVMLTDVIDGNDVRMCEIAGGLGLGTKALDRPRRCQRACGDGLQRHQAIQGTLACLEDHAHPAARDLLDQLVVAEAARAVRVHCARHACSAGHLQCRRLEERSGHLVRGQKRLHLAAQPVVVASGRPDERHAFGRLALERRQEDVGDDSPSFRVHLRL